AKEMKDAQIKSTAISEARLISPAFIPLLPARPRRDIFLGASVLTGLLVGVALAFFLEYINRTARGISDIEDFVGLKVIGTIPLVPQTVLVRRRIGYSLRSEHDPHSAAGARSAANASDGHAKRRMES